MISVELSRRVAKARQSEVFLRDLSFDDYLNVINTLAVSDAQSFNDLPTDIQELIESAEAAALTAAGDFDESKHKRDGKGRFAKKPGSGVKVGKKLKVTQVWAHKTRPSGTVVAVTADGRGKVVYTGGVGTAGGASVGPYTHYHRLSTDDEWQKGKSFPKGKAYKWFNDSIADGLEWFEPADESEDSLLEGDSSLDEADAIANAINNPKPKSTGPTKSKSKSSAGAPLKITHGLVHSKHEPGTIIAENGAGDKRVVWDGAEYRLQAKPPLEGKWLTDKKVKKSKAYAAINAYDSDWRVPTQAGGEESTNTATASEPAVAAPAPVSNVSPGTPGDSLKITNEASEYPQMDSTFTKHAPYKKGGIFKNKYGDAYKITPTQSVSHARNELLASQLYAYAAIGTDHVELVQTDPDKLHSPSGVGVKTSYKPSELGVVDAMKSIPHTKIMVNENFAFDAWLGNWDVVGLGYENLTVAKNGVVRRTNLGGSLLYRANGEPKGAAFGDTVNEIDSLRDPHLNPSAAKVFADVTDEDIRKGVAKIEKITPDDIDYLVSKAGFTGKEADLLSSKLQARRADLISKYGSNAPKPAQSSGPAPSTLPTATNALAGVTKTYTALQKSKVKSIFDKHNLHWYNKSDAIYDAAHEVSTTHPDLTMADALDIMDQSLKKKSGNPFRTKVEKWLKTKPGKNHALTKGGSASLGGTAPKVSPTPVAQQPVTTSATASDGKQYRKLSKPEATTMQNEMNKSTPPPWTADQRAALTKYTGGSYTTINKCARGTAPCDEETKKVLANINAAMKPSTRNVTLYRATNPQTFGISTGEELESLVGKVINDNGVISTSITKIGWSGKVHLEIEAPKGSNMAWVQPISLHPGENEMILAPGTHYEVVSYEKVIGSYSTSYRVKLRVIPGSDTHSTAMKAKELVSA